MSSVFSTVSVPNWWAIKLGNTVEEFHVIISLICITFKFNFFVLGPGQRAERVLSDKPGMVRYTFFIYFLSELGPRNNCRDNLTLFQEKQIIPCPITVGTPFYVFQLVNEVLICCRIVALSLVATSTMCRKPSSPVLFSFKNCFFYKRLTVS